MIPVTAAMAAFTAFNQFLCTPAGQKLALDAESIVESILGHFNVHLAANAPATNGAPAAQV